jgi:hypothetical protein
VNKDQIEKRHFEHLAAEALRNGDMKRYAHFANLAYRLELHWKHIRHPGKRADWVERL